MLRSGGWRTLVLVRKGAQRTAHIVNEKSSGSKLEGTSKSARFVKGRVTFLRQ